MKKISNLSRIAIGVSSLFLIITFFVPLWRIDLFAPQYPEGLYMQIWLYKLSGQVDVISGLNHYIGMARIEESMFPEFNYLNYAVAAYIFLALIVAITGKKKFLYSYFILSVILACLAMYDFYTWGYQYGHNLDPHAPIKVPGMEYQPPLIGHKTMLNFEAYSMPDIGGWIFAGFAAIVFGVCMMEWRASRKKIALSAAAMISVLMLFVSCAGGFKQINYGKDECDNCRMTIVDKKFAAEIITVKGKAFKFDDLVCVKNFMSSGKIEPENITDAFVNNYNKPGEFTKLSESFLASSESLSSPMNGNIAAFATAEEAMQFIGSNSGTSVDPQTIIKTK